MNARLSYNLLPFASGMSRMSKMEFQNFSFKNLLDRRKGSNTHTQEKEEVKVEEKENSTGKHFFHFR